VTFKISNIKDLLLLQLAILFQKNFLYRFSRLENAPENFSNTFLVRKMVRKIFLSFFLPGKWCRKFFYHFSCPENATENFSSIFPDSFISAILSFFNLNQNNVVLIYICTNKRLFR